MIESGAILSIWHNIKGYLAGALTLVACPCHLPLTFPLILSLTAGTALGTWLQGMFGLLFGILTDSFGQFISYALGMGTILIAVTIGSALFQSSVAKWLRRALPYVHRASAMFLVAAGAYLVYYWVYFTGLSF